MYHFLLKLVCVFQTVCMCHTVLTVHCHFNNSWEGARVVYADVHLVWKPKNFKLVNSPFVFGDLILVQCRIGVFFLSLVSICYHLILEHFLLNWGTSIVVFSNAKL